MFVGYKWQVNLNDIQTLHMQSSDIIFNAMSMPENTLVKIFNRSFLFCFCFVRCELNPTGSNCIDAIQCHILLIV